MFHSTFHLSCRRSEFLIEEAEASLMSNEMDKMDECLHDVVECLKAKTESKDDELLGFLNHDSECNCGCCSDVFLLNKCIHCLLIRHSYAFLASNEVKDRKMTNSSAYQVLDKAQGKMILVLEDLGKLFMISKGKKRKKVTFDDSCIGCIESELRTIVKNDTLFNLRTKDSAELFYFGYHAEFHSLDCSAVLYSQKRAMLDRMDNFLTGIRSRPLFPFFKVNHGRSLAKLIQCRVELYLSTEEGSKLVEFAWQPCKDEAERVGENDSKALQNALPERKKRNCRRRDNHVAQGSRRQKSTRKGAVSKKASKELSNAAEGDKEDKKPCSMLLQGMVPF